MKKTKNLFLLAATILLFNSCEKIIDENGYKITYYNNKKAIGYVYYFRSSSTTHPLFKDSIWPAKNVFITIESVYCHGWLFGVCKEHYDRVFTDESGKYSFDIVKTIDGKKVTGYFLHTAGGVPDLSLDDVRKQNIIQLDTSFIYY